MSIIPLISIITVNFNNFEGLKKTITSVFEQSWQDFEYLIIDGGSKDGSREYIADNSAKINYWVSEPDKGIYNAMNKGIKASRGSYLLFLNSGDWLVDKEVLNDVSIFLTGSDFLYGNIFRVYDDKRVQEQGTENISLKTFFKGSLNHQALFIHKKMFEKQGFYDEELKIVADWKFNLIAIGLEGADLVYVDRDISYYDMSGISNDNFLRNIEREIVLKELIPLTIYKDYKFFLELEDRMGSYRFSTFSRLDENKITRKIISAIFRIFKILKKE